MLTTVSRNVVDLFSKSKDAVNFIVGCSLLISVRNLLNSSRVPVHRRKMSSMNLLKNKIGSPGSGDPVLQRTVSNVLKALFIDPPINTLEGEMDVLS